MMLTQSFMQSFLSKAFNIPLQYVVPKQGNWFNAQDSGKEGFKVDTWCAFRISNAKPRTLPMYVNLSDKIGNESVVPMISNVDVQLVGQYAEYGVQSMAHWNQRADLSLALLPSGMFIFPDGLGQYSVIDFAQDGANSVLSYNARFRIFWNSEIATPQTVLQVVNLPSGITVLTSGYVTVTN